MSSFLTRWLEPMRRPEPTRVCPLVPADDPVIMHHMQIATDLASVNNRPETVRVDLDVFRRIRLEMRDA
jgi:hypothetical protein